MEVPHLLELWRSLKEGGAAGYTGPMKRVEVVAPESKMKVGIKEIRPEKMGWVEVCYNGHVAPYFELGPMGGMGPGAAQVQHADQWHRRFIALEAHMLYIFLDEHNEKPEDAVFTHKMESQVYNSSSSTSWTTPTFHIQNKQNAERRISFIPVMRPEEECAAWISAINKSNSDSINARQGTLPCWVRDVDATACFECRSAFGFFRKRHHCRMCGRAFCRPCSSRKKQLPGKWMKDNKDGLVRVCDDCAEMLDGMLKFDE